jgi:hypothetical protein
MAMKFLTSNPLDTDTSVAYLQASSAVNTKQVSNIDITCVIAGNNPSDQTFVDGDVTVGADTIDVTAHGYLTGMKVEELTTTGTLPGGLSLSTAYYIIVVDDDTISLATSQANAAAGTAVDITSAAGGGTHTINVDEDLAGSVKLQKNNSPQGPDNESAVWIDMIDGEIEGAATASQSFSAAANLNWALKHYGAFQVRAYVTVTSGTVTANTWVHGKE